MGTHGPEMDPITGREISQPYNKRILDVLYIK